MVRRRQCQAGKIEVDLRVGGRYSIACSCNGAHLQTVAGNYREVTPPARLVYTWQWLDDPDWEGRPSLVTVEFNEVAGGTEVVVTHEQFPNEESRGNHNQGWDQALEKLGNRLAS